MYVEDILLKIRDTLGINYNALIIRKNGKHPFNALLSDDWNIRFISNVGQHIDANKPLSVKQGAVILKLIESVRPYLVEYGFMTDTEISTMLVSPQFRHEPYESTFVPKEVRHLGGNLLAFRFKKNDEIKDALKAMCNARTTAWFMGLTAETVLASMTQKTRYDWLYRLWIVPVYRFNIRQIINFIEQQHFGWDEATGEYLKLARRSFNQPSRCAIHDGIILANVCDDPLLSGWITEVANGVAL